MAFNLVYLSQQDPQWKNDTLGFGDSGDTIGYVGCALTSVAMLLSGHGFSETPRSLNQKLKEKQGFVSAGIRWDVVSQVHPEVRLRSNVACESTDAPLAQIDAALAAGNPVVVRVDASPNPGLQWHYVLLYARKGDDYLMLDPWPYQPGTAREDLLMRRYSQGRSLRNAIQQVLFYEAAGSGGPISTPSTPGTSTTPPTPPMTVPVAGSGVHVRVVDSATWGLNIRTSTDTSSMANVVASVPAGTQLELLDPNDLSKIGMPGQWVRVCDPESRQGVAAAWYLERVVATTPTPVTVPNPEPVSESPVSTSTQPSTTPVSTPGQPSTPAPAEPARDRLSVVVSDAVGTSGLRLRTSPSMGGALVKMLKAGTRLVVIEPAEKAKAKIGKAHQWIYVREPKGQKGYVGAEYVKLT